MLPRAAQRLETTLLLSRQALPRPARLYSTPSRPAKAQGLAAVEHIRPDISYPGFLRQPSPSSRPIDEERILNSLERFLARDRTYTVLPTPQPPESELTKHGETWFSDTATQESMSIMDACLHNLYDVSRAKIIFNQLRQNAASSLLETGVYNAFIDAYFGMATQKDVENEEIWLADIYDIYDLLETEAENTAPNKMTYGLMLRVWLHFNRISEESSDSNEARSCVSLPTPSDLLEHMHRRQISPILVVTETVFDTHDAATEAIKTLSHAAVDLNIPEVIAELGQAEAIATFEDALKDVPEVMPVMREAKIDNKGNVVEEAAVPFNIIQLRRHLTEVSQTRRVLPEDVMARQKHLEKSAYDVALERLQQQNEKLDSIGVANPALTTSTIQQWMWDWHQKLGVRIQNTINELQLTETEALGKRVPRKATALTPFLTLVKAERLSLITILEVMMLQGSSGLTDGMKTTRAVVSVGKAVEMEYKAQLARKHQPSKETASASSTENTSEGSSNPDRRSDIYSQLGYTGLRQRRLANATRVKDSEQWSSSWPQALRSKIGGILVDCLMEVAEVQRTIKDKKTGETISEMQPAFHHAYEYLRGSKLGVIRLNPVVSERLAKDQLRDTLHPRHLPMLVKPRPWINHDIGGYLYSKTRVMRYKDSLEQEIYLQEASRTGQFELVYSGLDVLGSTPWNINRKVFDVVLQVWNSGERVGKVPPAIYDAPKPEIPENYTTDMKARSIYIQRQKAYNQAKAGNHSDRCSVNYKMEIARALLNDTFYFPHNLDFRGRAYPIPAHLNHIGDDLSRGLLTFAVRKPLGERGLRWLKIHIANLYGYDKANFDDRVKWVDEHIKEIYETATNPLNGSRWWLSAGDPWQFLASSIELHAALESGDPHTFESNLPVHQDGTCNGLQHYAALGGDAQGAKQVNLEASEKPSDVYSHVGMMVENVIAEDALRGGKFAIMLQGKITRKVVKQTVMTTVYGVTYVGARDQIEKQLKDRGDIHEEDCWGAASYLAHLVLGCIGNLFSGAKAIQTWLNLCARVISKSIPEERIPELMTEYFADPIERAIRQSKAKMAAAHMRRMKEIEAGIDPAVVEAKIRKASKPQMVTIKPDGKRPKNGHLPLDILKKEQMTSVIWTTPLGLPIVQPYRKTARKQVKTAIQTVYISDPNSLAEVNSTKQASAFPPNFIHSLDATHMILTALECDKKKLTFASVHDSYWTHAADIDEMSSVIRDTFIALHSSDVLSELQREFLKRYKDFKVPLINLTGTSLATRLYNAGSRIYATPKQARSLSLLKDLVIVTEDLSTVDESRAVTDEKSKKQLLNDLETSEKSKSKSKSSSFKDENENENGVSLGEVDNEFPSEMMSHARKLAKEKKEQHRQAAVDLMGKFVNLSDLVPPLPKKGEFDVGSIKKSLYFFS